MDLSTYVATFLIFICLSSSVLGDETEFLKELLKSISPIPETWSPYTFPCAKWIGINCDSSGRVTSIDLSSKSISGSIPFDLYQLPKIKRISFQNNKLSGPLPNFSNLTYLEEIFLDSNNFTSVPHSIFYGLISLQTLSLSDNGQLKPWFFPHDLTQCRSLVTINATNVNLAGTISTDISNIVSLENLLLSNNNLTGSIPFNLTSLNRIRIIDVSNNNLSEKVPPFSSHVSLISAGNPFLGSSTSSNSPPSSDQPGGFKGIIVGIVIVVLILLILFGFGLFFGYKYYMKNVNCGNLESPKNQNVASNSYAGVEGGDAIMSFDSIRQVTGNFNENNILGKGGSCIVYKGELDDGTKIAVKRMVTNSMGTQGLAEFQAEISVLTKVNYRYLVSLIGFCVNENDRLLVYEYMPQGTLSDRLFHWNSNGGSPLTWKQRVSIALDVARGVDYLHSLANQSFIHRDLKPTNILLGKDMMAKVADFGLVKIASDGKHSLETRLTGTFGYLAPEYATTGRVTRMVDVYAYGVVLMELLTGRKALEKDLPEEQVHIVPWFRELLTNKDGISKAIDSTLDLDEETLQSILAVAALAGHCTVRNHSKRPQMSHAVSVLSALVEHWEPSHREEEDGDGIDFRMSLSQALQRWQSNEGSSTMGTDSYSHTL